MHIAILGSGNLGSALGRGWSARGHAISFGVRDVTEGGAAVKGGLPDGARVATLDDAVREAEVVVLAMPAAAVADVITVLGAALDARIVVDATNPVGAGLQLMTGAQGESQGERTATLLAPVAPHAHVIKCFNQTGANIVNEVAAAATSRDASAPGAQPVMFVAGDDVDARRTVLGLARELGFAGVDAGALVRARELERLAMLWISLSASPTAALGRDFAFALIKPVRAE